MKLIEWITGKKLMERWGMDEYELLQINQRGLTVYKKWEGPFLWSPSLEDFKLETKDLLKNEPDYTDSVGNEFKECYPDSEDIPSMIFKLSDIEFFESEFGLEQVAEEIKVEPTTKTAEKPEESQYIFHKSGDFWEIKFKKETTKLRDLERLRYVIHLLSKPHMSMSVFELMRFVKGTEPEVAKEFQGISERNELDDEEEFQEISERSE